VSIFHGLNGAIEEFRNSALSDGRFLLAANGRKNQIEAYSSKTKRAKESLSVPHFGHLPKRARPLWWQAHSM
jgi:hypothetical protein